MIHDLFYFPQEPSLDFPPHLCTFLLCSYVLPRCFILILVCFSTPRLFSWAKFLNPKAAKSFSCCCWASFPSAFALERQPEALYCTIFSWSFQPDWKKTTLRPKYSWRKISKYFQDFKSAADEFGPYWAPILYFWGLSTIASTPWESIFGWI